jgi:phage recombination protein Bet
VSDTNGGARVIAHPTLLRPFRISAEVKRYLRSTQYPPPREGTDEKRLTNEEFELFIAVCEQRRLDPLKRHIYATKRWNTEQGKKVLSVEATIDGLRLTADRTGRYRGQTRAMWAGTDGKWVDAWLAKEPPAAAMVGVWRDGDVEPITAVAHFDEFAQRYDDGYLIGVWKEKPRLMLAKCAEALALRKAFPEELGGLYTAEELDREQSTAPAGERRQGPVTVPERPAAAAVVAGIAPLAEACAEVGYTIVAVHALAHLASGGQQVESLTTQQAARATGWARALADARVDERTLTEALTWVVTNASDWTAAQQQLERWIARKHEEAAKASAAAFAPALPAAPTVTDAPATPATDHVPLQVVVS